MILIRWSRCVTCVPATTTVTNAHGWVPSWRQWVSITAYTRQSGPFPVDNPATFEGRPHVTFHISGAYSPGSTVFLVSEILGRVQDSPS